MRALAALLAAALLVGGCGSSELPPYEAFRYAPGDWTSDELGALEQAVSAWNAQIGPRLSLVASANPNVRKVAPEVIPGAWGYWTGTGAEILLACPPARTQEVMMHEIGHALGLEHVESGVMRDLAGYGPKFSTQDIEECVRVGACIP